MGRTNTPLLTEATKASLDNGHKTGATHAFRTRCHVILLKATGRTSIEVGAITGMSDVSVNAWVRRYNAFGVEGLKTRPGRGRKPLLTAAADKETVLHCVKTNRQRIQTAKAEWEQQSGKSVSLSTLKSFLKALTVDTSAFENAAKGSPTRTYTP